MGQMLWGWSQTEEKSDTEVMKTSEAGETRGPIDLTHIELPYIVSEPLQIHQQGLIMTLSCS